MIRIAEGVSQSPPVLAKLERSPAFGALDPVTHAAKSPTKPSTVSRSRAICAGRAPPTRRPRQGQGTGAWFTAGALREGVDQFGRFVDVVNFPQFVSSIIGGVFTSIVDSSIRQMEADAKLREAVVASVQDFADQNVSPDDARGYLQQTSPTALRNEGRGGQGRLLLNPELADAQIPDFDLELGLAQSSFFLSKSNVKSPTTRDTSQESESFIDTKAKLTVEVSVNFQSETFPLDRIDPADMSMIQDRAHEQAGPAPQGGAA